MRQKTFWVSLAGVGLALAACTAPTSEPTPQPTQAPPTETPVAAVPTTTEVPSVTPPPAEPAATATPAATETETATATPTVPPTATVPPTPDPNEGVGDVVFEDKLDGTGGWFWTWDDEVASFAVSGEQKMLLATAKRNDSWSYVSSNDVVNVGDQQVRATVRIDACAAEDAYGLMFRGTADATTGAYNMYIFEVNCSGAARLTLLQNGLTALTNWVSAPVIKTTAGEENTLMVWMAKDQMRFYVNDEFLFAAQDATLSSGFYGFFLRDRTNSNMRVAFKDLVAKSVSGP